MRRMPLPVSPIPFLRRFDWAGAARAGLNLALLAGWIWLYWPVIQYLSILFTREEFRTNQIVLLAVTGLLIYRVRKIRLRPRLDTVPGLHLPALALALGGSLTYLLVERFLDINTLSAFLFGLASYGLVGLWLAPQRWRQGFPAMLLVVGVLPFGEHLETFVGYPLRAFTAELVRGELAGFGFHSVGADTILVFESGISQVDIPCSGVKSLWTGALFLLAATWIENRPLSLRWLGVAAVTAALLFFANLARVTLLALTGPALGWTLLARMLHVPLGVLGFVGVCAVALFLLRRLPERIQKSEASGKNLVRPRWLGPVLGMCVLVMALAYTPRSVVQASDIDPTPVWSFPAELTLQPAPLSTQELDWIRQGGAETVERYTFQWQPSAAGSQPVGGTFMLLTSQTWRSQHRPERCFEVYGLTVQESFTYLTISNYPLRYLTLTGRGTPVSAVYWLQSASQTTEDFGRRIWSDLGPERERWVLVTILFNRQYDPKLPELQDFWTALHASLERSLVKGETP